MASILSINETITQQITDAHASLTEQITHRDIDSWTEMFTNFADELQDRLVAMGQPHEATDTERVHVRARAAELAGVIRRIMELVPLPGEVPTTIGRCPNGHFSPVPYRVDRDVAVVESLPRCGNKECSAVVASVQVPTSDRRVQFIRMQVPIAHANPTLAVAFAKS